MEKYELDLDEIGELVNHAIDIFLKYEYELGYDEPRARMETIQEIVRALTGGEEGAK